MGCNRTGRIAPGEEEGSRCEEILQRVRVQAGATAAKRSRKSLDGTNGGVGIATPKHQSSTVRGTDSTITDNLPNLSGDNWFIVILHRRGLDFAYGVVYLECGGNTGNNKRRATELGTALRALGLPFAVAGDYNATPQEAEDWDYTKLIGGTVLVPEHCDATCTSGQGRLIDYWIVSRPGWSSSTRGS